VCVGEPELRVTRWQESMREGEAEMRRVPFGFCESSGRLGSIAASIAAGCDDAHAARDPISADCPRGAPLPRPRTRCSGCAQNTEKANEKTRH
jgi:hypothetical protein